MNRNNLNLVSNNVKALQGRDKRMKLFEYLKNCISSNGFVFLQETHSSLNVEGGLMNSRVSYFFLMVKPTHAE